MGLGKTYSTKYLLDSNNSSGVAGQVLSTTSTGIDWVNANTVPGAGLWIASGNNIYNNNTGNVGIGTTLPSAKLNIVNTASTSIPALQVASSASLANNDIIRFQINGLTNGFRMFQNASSVVNYTFQDGNVGIGTTSPTAKLSLSGSQTALDLTRGTAGDSKWGLSSDSTALYIAELSTGSTDYVMTFKETSGNVGIGTTTNIDAPLTVQSNGSAATINLIGRQNGVFDESILGFYDNDGTTRKGYILNSGGNMFFSTGNGSENMTILSNGNVGIGVTNPQAKLEIGSSSGAASGQYNSPSALLISTSGGSAGAGGTLLFGADGSSASDIQWSISNNNTASNATGSVGNLNFNTKDTLAGTILSPAMTILPGGNVGIGTTTPASKLEVSGRISGGELGSSDVCRNGLLFYVDFNDKACVSGTLATEVPIDLGPQNLQMSLVGGANFEYKDGIGCYYFDGSNDHILIQSYVVADTVNSYEIWHYAVAQVTYETWWDSGTERPLLGTYNDDLIAYPAYNTTSLGDKINLGKWYHVVWAMNGNNDMDIFVNGKRTHEGLTGGMGQRTGTFNAQLGGDTSAETTNGFIAITRTYSRQLTPKDVLQNYNAEVERFAPVTPSLGIVQIYGNVGIGTTTPGASLAVQASFSNNGGYTTSNWAKYIILDAANTGGGGIIWSKQTGTYNRALLNNQGKFEIGRSTADDDSAVWLSDLTINAIGNVGIGTDSPGQKLEVQGTILVNNEIQFVDSNMRIFRSGTNMHIRTGGSDKVIIESNGAVGINVTNPQEKLEVDGNIFVTLKFGNLTAGSQGIQFEAPTTAMQTCRFDSDALRFFAGGSNTTRFTITESAGSTFVNTVTATNFILSSDERLKENIKTLEPKVISAEWKSFNAKDDDSYRTGVIAQELEVKHPEFVETNEEGFKSVKYIDLLISKIVELEHRIKQLEK